MPTIKLNKNNLYHNLDLICKKTGDITKVAAVLKDNAYGHGLEEMSVLISEYGIKKAVVRDVEEAVKIKHLFSHIIILAQMDFHQLNHSYSHTFHIVVNSLEQIEQLPQNIKVHLKVNTGMNRNGINPNALEEAILGLCRKNIQLTGVMTHFKSADCVDTEYYVQNQVFYKVKKEVKKICEKLSLEIPEFHSCNSAGLFRCEKFSENIARTGIAMYGYIENDDVLDFPEFKPVLSLWANKISTRVINKNDSVGYGGKFLASEKMTVSTYDLGYGNGFLRLNGEDKYQTKDGFTVLGKVSMDNLSLNTDKDEVCIFEDVRNLAKIHNTICYEITTTLSPFIKKIII